MNNEAVVREAYAVARGEAWVPRNERGEPIAGLCLAQVRTILERAYGFRAYQLYDDYVTEWVQPAGYNRAEGHWARDAERSLRNLGMGVPYFDRQPGDLVFNYEAAYSKKWRAYVGHVGVLLHGDLVLENIHPANRLGVGFMRDMTALTPAQSWRRVTTVIRFRARASVI